MYKIKEGLEKDYQDYAEKNSDPYGGAVVKYARRWAEMMEKRIKKGEIDISQYAEDLSHKADKEGITGFMYGCAVQELSHYWKHGEELRKWHNGEYGHDGDGVVNPAIL